jgi:H+/Cl- antiporter ClcA
VMAPLLRGVVEVRRRALPHLHSETLMLSLAVAVGLATGVLASVLIGLVALVGRVAFGTSVSWPLLVGVPTAGAFAVGLLVTYLFPESSGSGVLQVMTRIVTHGGRFRARVPVGGILSTGVALGPALPVAARARSC